MMHDCVIHRVVLGEEREWRPAVQDSECTSGTGWSDKLSVYVSVQILSKFLDLKDGSFSIQRIAVQGIDLGRRVGEWFGPNTIAHVLR